MSDHGPVLRRLGDAIAGASAVGRTVLPLNPVPQGWTHVTKVDPEPRKRFPLLYPLYLQHTDAVSVGGSSDVTDTNTEETFALLSAVDRPAVHEPSEARHVTERTRERAALLTIPEVLNGTSDALVGTLGVGVEYIREELIPGRLDESLPWWVPSRARDGLADVLTSWLLRTAAFEAYLIQNPDSAAAERAGVTAADVLTPAEAKQRAMAADRHLDSEVCYVEYSGTYGGEEAEAVLAAIDGNLTRSRLWYGGGIDSREKARTMLDAGADAVVVGDVFHRVASEEAELCAAASGALDADVSPAAVREWLADRVVWSETSAARYLSTVPSVAHPTDRARRYLTTTVGLWLALDAAADGRGTAAGDHESAAFPGDRRAFDDAVGDDDTAARYLQDLRALAGGAENGSRFPVGHLSVAGGGS